MATSTKIQLTANEKPAFFVAPLKKESAEKVSELLQENHEKYHIYFNYEGFHNHIVHHLLTLYALGATPSAIQAAYDANKTYQRPPVPLHPRVTADLSNRTTFAAHLGDEAYYGDYLVHFARELDAKGVSAVLSEYLFARDERADDLLVRTFAGFVHPLIHLGFGVEFAQPTIVAEALAQAATHDAWIGGFLLGAERVADAQKKEGKADAGVTLGQLLAEIRADEKLAGAARWEDANKLRDGVVGRAGKEMCELAAKWVVDENSSEKELERKTAEMIDASVFFTAAPQRPPHVAKIDFFYMHSVTSSIFFTSFLTSPLFPSNARARLLEWKGRFDLAGYASRGAPELPAAEIVNYVSSNHRNHGWQQLFDRVNSMTDDDGHTPKLLRAVANGAQACAKLRQEDRRGFAIEGQDAWLKAAAMGMDGVQAGGPKWLRSGGFEKAWAEVPVRADDGQKAQL
ncbi:uncharacterized protein LTHEOB_3701 [Lasiodiplodia theobromae]|uniref:uncharacterized protein n=1 Tax=Lasiodiplodia theobromae TaxID=45133 RepID=UPI0015C3E5A5|nr:uncharacterized protein LTHEOB_3701 [Lasiodiplodia theobromae]KAF4534088.1 hypothetical protein LTHEOB_3701 [Lasiodiplodia theobromae]